ncbi:class I histocompatibility antigen, F10 alpha chain-like [Hyla sarda]|uniref:class I histocompatibility antigen, F10 alpha chain-like n=1 Tax=Hyla sarda TaxID=327740 RepID=UPI0024C23EAC|nr:class I histocompatibility antigen, F10 alpha chain-like [Hyla sarda]
MRKMYPLIVLLLHLSAVYCDTHTLRYYYTVISAPGSGLPEFSIVGYVDDREIVNYNSDSGRMRPKVQWMEKVEPGYWEENTQIAKGNEAVFKHNVRTAMSRFNQTAGFHIVQLMYGCELGDDGTIRGYDQYGYDGEEFMSLDTQTGTYISTMAQAQITAQRWNSPEEQEGERRKNYVENICIEWLKKHVKNGREDLERRVRPEVKVSGQEEKKKLTLHCQAYGFHPKPVDVKWMKNGVDDLPTYQTTHVLPNPDGTYQIQVTAEVIPKEGDSYSCYVDHSSLGEEPLLVKWEPAKPSSWVIPVVLVVVVIALLGVGIGGFLLYRKKKQDYKPTSTSETSSDQSINAAKA